MPGRTFAKVQLVATLVALALWIGWLGHMAFTRGRFPVVSHSQLLNAPLGIVADVTVQDGQAQPSVTVVEVLWPKGSNDLVGKTIAIESLATATISGGPTIAASGKYVVPLVKDGEKYRVAGLPPIQPGFPESAGFFVYPDVPIVREQVAEAGKIGP